MTQTTTTQTCKKCGAIISTMLVAGETRCYDCIKASDAARDADAAARDRAPTDPVPHIVADGYRDAADAVSWDAISQQIEDWVNSKEWVVFNPPRGREEADPTEVVRHPDMCFVQVPRGMTGEALGLPSSARWTATVMRPDFLYRTTEDRLDVETHLSMMTKDSGATYLVAEFET